MAAQTEFEIDFQSLTSQKPFPWQSELYARLIRGEETNACDIPTGLGKTSIIAIWLIALARHPERMPRRLVYVVNRRTVVDQTTSEVERLRANLEKSGLWKPLQGLCATLGNSNDPPLAISTLRGQFADNREWSSDPTRPAVIVGTVDMIGSRLLFGGYGLGFRGKPLHAGFLGQDVLLVHDEAHLEQPFQELLETILAEQQASQEFKSFRVLELSATSRNANPMGLTPDDYKDERVCKRIDAHKAIKLHPVPDEKGLAEKIASLAKEISSGNDAIAIFVRKLGDVVKIGKLLSKEETWQLTGTMRGYERDQKFDPRKEGASRVFAKFLPTQSTNGDESLSWKVTPIEKTGYLICTSAGEVGINISARHLVCDLTCYESMAQRFGRVNRFGEWGEGECQIHIVYPTNLDASTEYDQRRTKTLALLQGLKNGSPRSLSSLNPEARADAFSPIAPMLQASSSLFDAWALTSIKSRMPGRPPVEQYLHGREDDEVQETLFVWRAEVECFGSNVDQDDVELIFESMPIRPHELLRMTTYGKGRAYDQLQKLSQRFPKLPVWVMEPDGTVITSLTIERLAEKKGANYLVPLAARTVILPPIAGGLSQYGTLDGNETLGESREYDVAEKLTQSESMQRDSDFRRFRVILNVNDDEMIQPTLISEHQELQGLEEVRIDQIDQEKRLQILTSKLKDLGHSVRVVFSAKLEAAKKEDFSIGAYEYLIFQKVSARKEKKLGTPEWPSLKRHAESVRDYAVSFCEKLGLSSWLPEAIKFAAVWHDLGKRRRVWQLGSGNKIENSYISKTIHGRPPEKLNRFRHEFGSVLDLLTTEEFAAEFMQLTDDQRDVVLHLIICHHGRGRPYFDVEELHDPEVPDELARLIAEDVPERFARLQRKFGRWGLAYIESILRSADILDSQRIESTPMGVAEKGKWLPIAKRLAAIPASRLPIPTIAIDLNTANPGQFFACCGLFELANKVWNGAEAWFEGSRFCIQCEGDLSTLLNHIAGCELTNTMSDQEHSRFRELELMSKMQRGSIRANEEYDDLCKKRRERPIVLKAPFHLAIDWFVDDLAGGSRFKTWAGQQGVLEIASKMKTALDCVEWRNEQCLSFTKHGCGLPFNFDSDLGAQGGANDIGFSFDAIAGNAMTRFEQPARPALELLAFVGLQRFRPAEEGRAYRYLAWNRPLPINIAFAAACTAIPFSGAQKFEFKLLYRTKYLKSFLPAVPIKGDFND